VDKIFISGGAGFIGSAIFNQLQSNGHEILIYDNLSFGQRKFVDVNDDHFVLGNILDQEHLNLAIKDFAPHIVIHLAAIHFIPYCNEFPFESSNINIKGTSNLLAACKQLSCLKKFFFASTAAVYPVHDTAISELLEPQPLDIYGLTKFAGEELVKKFHSETRVPSILCRFFNAFGPNETNPHLIPEIQKQINRGERVIHLGNTEPKRDFIHTHDMARAVSLLLEKFNGGIDTFNLGQGTEYSVLEVVSAFERVIGEDIRVVVDPERIRKSDRLHLVADISKLSALTGWQPCISLEQGLKTLLT